MFHNVDLLCFALVFWRNMYNFIKFRLQVRAGAEKQNKTQSIDFT